MGYSNPQRRNAFIWLSISGIGFLMVMSPFLFEVDMLDGGGALMMVGILLFITGIITSVLFFSRSAAIKRMFTGEGLLAHWTYDNFTWRKHAEKEYTFRKGVNRSMFFLIAGMCLFMGIVFFIIDNEDGKYVFFIIVAVSVLLGAVAFLTAWVPYRRSLKRVSEAFISREGAYINGQFHTWRGFGTRLEGVRLLNSNSVEFVYSYVSRAGRQQYVFHVPVPEGEHERAMFIVNFFNGYM